MKTMKQPRHVQTEEARLDGARLFVFWSKLALIASLAFANRGLVASHLAYDLMLIIFPVTTLVIGALWLFSRSKWFQSLTAASEPQPNKKQLRSKRRSLIADCIGNGFVGAVFSILAFEKLQNPLLGWVYKAGLIVAVNVFAFAVSRSALLALSGLKHASAQRRAAQKHLTASSAIAPTNDAPALSTDPKVAPLAAGQGR